MFIVDCQTSSATSASTQTSRRRGTSQPRTRTRRALSSRYWPAGGGNVACRRRPAQHTTAGRLAAGWLAAGMTHNHAISRQPQPGWRQPATHNSHDSSTTTYVQHLPRPCLTLASCRVLVPLTQLPVFYEPLALTFFTVLVQRSVRRSHSQVTPK